MKSEPSRDQNKTGRDGPIQDVHSPFPPNVSPPAIDVREIVEFLEEEQFYECTQLARDVLEVDHAAIIILDENNLWIRASNTLEPERIPREEDFGGGTTLVQNKKLILTDPGEDLPPEQLRFLTEHGVRFYAGMPFDLDFEPELDNPHGIFCLMDSKPRTLSEPEFNKFNRVKNFTVRLIEKKFYSLRSQKARSRLNGTLNSTRDGILILVNGQVANYNRAFATIWDLPEPAAGNQNPDWNFDSITRELKEPDPLFESALANELDHQSEISNTIELKDGRILERTALPRYVDEQHRGWIFSYRDVTEHHELRERLASEVKYDKQTGLLNREEFERRLKNHLKQHRSENKTLALLSMNVDHFSRINRSLGYSNGDKALRAIGDRLRSVTPEDGLLCRFEGDKFMMTLPHVSSDEPIHDLARSIRAQFSEPIEIEGTKFRLDLDIGVSVFPRHAETLKDLIVCVNTAMSHSPDVSSDLPCQFYLESMDSFDYNLLKLEEDFRNGFRSKAFDLHYQPRIALPDRTPRGMEALIRWHHPDYGTITPDVILHLASSTKKSFRLDRYVLREASYFVQDLIHRTERSPLCSINISAETFLHGHNLVETVDEFIRAGTLPSECIELEITERTAMANIDLTRSVLSDLSDLGVTIAVDDFGTGYSTFSYLTDFPVDVLKIDRQFISDLHKKTRHRKLVKFIVELAHSLDLLVVAEGPEKAEEVECLIDLNCDEAQGFYFARPQEASEATDYWNQHASPASSGTDTRDV